MGEKTFNLTWNNHLANLSGLFEGLYKSGSLTDTTLACQGGMLRAHRLVLAACSPYFERVFKEHYGDQPILILKGVAVEEMECLLDFMYRGSIDVAEEHLPSLIKTATDLEIRGLSADHKNESNNANANTKVDGRMQRCHIETRVQTTEHRRENASSDSFEMKQGNAEDHIKMEEIEDDPMVIEHEDSYDAPLSTAEDQIKHIPPPMFKRETRYKGQKRVSVGRSSKSNDSLEVRLRDRASLRETVHGDSFEEGVSLNSVKQEPMFNNSCSDPTVPAIQLNEDIYDQEQESSESPSGGTNDSSKSSAAGKKSEAGKRGNEGRGGKILSRSLKAQYKPFSCDLCTLAFTRASHLARHRRVHTGERPFACTLCPRMFARQDKLKQHLDSHLQWPKRRAFSGLSSGGNAGSTTPGKGKRGRPRKILSEQSAMKEIMKFGEFSSLLNKLNISSEQSAMEEIMKFGEFSSLLNKSQPSNSVCNNELSIGCTEPEPEPDDEDAMLYKNSDSYGCQVENGQDVE